VVVALVGAVIGKDFVLRLVLTSLFEFLFFSAEFLLAISDVYRVVLSLSIHCLLLQSARTPSSASIGQPHWGCIQRSVYLNCFLHPPALAV
jgi:hypothetical protein